MTPLSAFQPLFNDIANVDVKKAISHGVIKVNEMQSSIFLNFA